MGFSKIYVSHAGERDGDSIWRLLGDLKVFFEYKGKPCTLIIPRGFLTDFGSIPKFAQVLFSPTDPEMLSCFIFHDYLYEKNGKILVISDDELKVIELDRYESDLIPLWRMSKKQGASYFKRFMIFNSVRAGGGKAWNNAKKLKIGDRFKLLDKIIK